MQRRWFTLAVTIATAVIPAALCAQTASADRIPDLSGDWLHPVVLSLSPSDPRGTKRGKEDDVPYRPETLKAMMAETPATGADGRFELTTDPYIQYCEPLGVVRMFGYPSKTRFVQTAEAVYILDEIGPTFRMVWLNAKHPDDPDPQYWGHAIGHYENGDALVVDTVGLNEKTWFDQVAHPHSDQLHLIERFRRVDDKTLAYQITIDDPGAYTRTWTSGPRNFTRSETGFMRYQWVCSARDTREHYEKVGSAGNPGPTSTFK